MTIEIKPLPLIETIDPMINLIDIVIKDQILRNYKAALDLFKELLSIYAEYDHKFKPYICYVIKKTGDL